jgi:hypothetical protein
MPLASAIFGDGCTRGERFRDSGEAFPANVRLSGSTAILAALGLAKLNGGLKARFTPPKSVK